MKVRLVTSDGTKIKAPRRALKGYTWIPAINIADRTIVWQELLCRNFPLLGDEEVSRVKASFKD